MTPEPDKTGQPKRRPRPWEKAFLTRLGECGNISLACQAAKVGRSTAYDCRRASPDFAAAWDAAMEEAADVMEEEARRRAVEGVPEPVIHQGRLCGRWVDAEGKDVAEGTAGAILVPLTVRKYSDVLLMFLLKGARPEKFRERTAVEHTGRGGGPIETKHDHGDLTRLPQADLLRLYREEIGAPPQVQPERPTPPA